MKTFVVKLHGKPLAEFGTKDEARDFLLKYLEAQMLTTQSLALIDEAVLKSDMSEAKTIIKHIMELPNA